MCMINDKRVFDFDFEGVMADYGTGWLVLSRIIILEYEGLKRTL
jgi:hypothetical protein